MLLIGLYLMETSPVYEAGEGQARARVGLLVAAAGQNSLLEKKWANWAKARKVSCRPLTFLYMEIRHSISIGILTRLL